MSRGDHGRAADPEPGPCQHQGPALPLLRADDITASFRAARRTAVALARGKVRTRLNEDTVSVSHAWS